MSTFTTKVMKRRLSSGVLPGPIQADAGVGAQRPVVVLARAVDAFEGLFVQQDTETVLAADFTHQRHDQQVVVVGEVAFLEDRVSSNWFGATSL